MARGPRVHVAISGNRSGSITSRVLRAHHFATLLDDVLRHASYFHHNSASDEAAMIIDDETNVVL